MGLFNFLEKRIDLADVEQAKTIIGNIEDRLSTKALAFYLATSYIADTISKCEIKRFVKGEMVKDSFYYLFNVSPNVNENASQLKAKLIYKLFTENEALLFENKGCLYVADSFSREPQPIKGDKFTDISLHDETKTFTRKASDVFYFNLGEEKLKLLIDSMLNDFSEMLKYSMDIYKSSNDEKYKLILDEVKAGDKDFNEIFEKVVKKQLETFINNRKAVYPQYKGYNLEKMSVGDGKTDSTDIRNLRKEIFEATAEAFKMPVSMLYGNMTNAKDIIASYVTFRIDPLAKMISEELTRKTGTMDDYMSGTYFDVDTTMIMHLDIFEIADKVDKLLASGVYCIDELRGKLGEHKIDNDFSKQHWMTKNYSKVEDVLDGEETTMSTTSNSDSGSDDTNSNDDLSDPNIDTDGTIASISLNGAQIQSLLQIVSAVANNELEYDSAVVLITSAFPFDEDTAKLILGDPSSLTSDKTLEGGE